MSETEKKSGLVDWDSVDAGQRNKSEIDWLRLKDKPEHTVRLVHRPKPISRYYKDGKSAICGDVKNCPVALKHNIQPKDRYAIIVIDRSDKKVKIMEAPASLFKRFRDFWKVNDIDPGSNDGPDFVISIEGQGLNTRYTVEAKQGSKPFTDEEKMAIRAKKAENNGKGYDLDLIFAPTPVDKIEEQLGLVPSTGSSTTKSSATTTTTPSTSGKAQGKKDDFDF